MSESVQERCKVEYLAGMTKFKTSGTDACGKRRLGLWHVRYGFLTLLFASCSVIGWGQKAIELDGMMEVAQHHGLDEFQIEAEWPQHIAEAVLISYGWHKVSHVKSDAIVDRSFEFQKDMVISSLLRKDVMPRDKVVFYPCTDGTYIQVISTVALDKFVGRYALNAKAFLKKR